MFVFLCANAKILPRGFALGFVSFLPGMDRLNQSRSVQNSREIVY
jgi:hypothetical protein